MSTSGFHAPAVNTPFSIVSYNSVPSSHPNSAAIDAAQSLKRPASPYVDEERKNRKRKKADMDNFGHEEVGVHTPHAIDGDALAEDLAQELQCGCCSGLVYKPVVVMPCDHFFCGSCCTLWVKNGGTNCPACRSVSTAVMPSRALQSMVDVLLRAAPHRQRTERERMQADEIYSVLRPFRIPVPREPSPEPVIPPSSEFVQPCPHCSPNNPFHWTCSQPIADPTTDSENAWRIDAGTPPGHGFCGNCEVLLALRAPSTSRCDFCQVSFCGINVQGRCMALPIPTQSPHGLTDVGDLIQSPEIYDCFEGKTVEVELMLDYMTSQRLSPKQVYRQIATYIQSQPDSFVPLIEQDIFMDIHPVPGGTDPDPDAPRRFICRLCATEMLLYGLRDWWIRERRKAVIEGKLEGRTDCPNGGSCRTLSDPAHAKEFNHLISHDELDRAPQATVFSSSTSSLNSTANRDILPSVTSSLFLPPISSDPLSGSSAHLPSISNLVAELTQPQFNLPTDIFARFSSAPDTEHGVEQRATTTVLSGDVHSQLSRPPSHGDVDSEDDIEFAEPSSSQSQRSVEAHLTQNSLAEYSTDVESNMDGRVPGQRGAEADAHLEASYAETVAQREADIPVIRRTQSPLKRDSDMGAAMTDNRSAPATGFPSFRFLPDLSYLPDTTTPPASSAYPVQVE